MQIEGAWIAGCDAGQLRLDDDVTCRANAIGFYHVTPEGAVAAWNRRVPSGAALERPTDREIGLAAALNAALVDLRISRGVDDHFVRALEQLVKGGWKIIGVLPPGDSRRHPTFVLAGGGPSRREEP